MKLIKALAVLVVMAMPASANLAAPPTYDPKMNFTIYDCSDLYTCNPYTCQTTHKPSDTCFLEGIPLHGDTWDCEQVQYGPCFLIRKYPQGSNCTGTPISNRANFCDECKGQDPHDFENMQHRRCTFGYTNGQFGISSVGYHNCQGEQGNISCVNCQSTANITFGRGQCVTYEDAEWRLEESYENCPLMKHVNFLDTECKKFWWGDRIVLNQCNNGFMFTCPNTLPMRKH